MGTDDRVDSPPSFKQENQIATGKNGPE